MHAMKISSMAAALALAATASGAADLKMVTKAPPPPTSPWDIAFGAALMSDYVFRGVTQSNRKPSATAYVEPRYNINDNFQLYAGVSGESISFANRAAAEVDFYGGIRPTFGKLSLDIGGWYYWYPGGQCFNAAAAGDCAANGSIPVNGNVMKADVSFWEVYAKGAYALTDSFAVGGNFFYTPSFLNFGAPGQYASVTAKYTLPAFANGVSAYVSGEFGRQWLGTTDSFYGGIDLADYNTWNAGVGFGWKTFTLDLRYSDTNLSKGDCNAFTSDFTARSTGYITPINAAPGYGSNWCGAAFIAKLSIDLTANANLK